jgi:hypothetical protein
VATEQRNNVELDAGSGSRSTPEEELSSASGREHDLAMTDVSGVCQE